MRSILVCIAAFNTVLLSWLLIQPSEIPYQQPLLPQFQPLVPPEEGPKPVEEPVWTDYPVQNQRDSSSSFFADVINHVKGRPFSGGDRDTQAHETTHGINSEIRNSFRKTGFYVGNNRVILMDEPKMKLSQIADFVPDKLRAERFNLYLKQQQIHWENSPSYVMDEAVAYLNGSRVSVEEASQSNSGRTNSVFSCVEFSVYSLSFAMAVKKYDPQYFETNTQFKQFIIWYVKNALQLYKKGQAYPQFRWNDSYYEELKNGELGRVYREFLEKDLKVDLKYIFD